MTRVVERRAIEQKALAVQRAVRWRRWITCANAVVLAWMCWEWVDGDESYDWVLGGLLFSIAVISSWRIGVLIRSLSA